MHSYETFILNELPTYIKSQNPIRLLTDPFQHPTTDEKLYKYEVELFVGGEDGTAIYIAPPTFQQGSTIRRLFPNDARLWNISYSINFSFDILVRYTISTIDEKTHTVKVDKSDVVFSKHQLFAIPILLKSKFCSTHGATSTLLTKMDECKHEQGGYFIVNGKEKVLITRQEQAFNAIIITKKPESDPKIKLITSVNCQHPVTRLTRNVTMYILKGEGKSSDLENVIRINIPQVNGAIPVFILFRALGVDTDEEIVNMIVPDSSSVEGNSIKNFLYESILDAYPIINQSLAIEFIRTLTKGFIIENVLQILNEQVFSHVQNMPLTKAQYLAEWVRKTIRVQLGYEMSTERDDIKNQRFLSTGSLLRSLFTAIWRSWKKDVLAELEGKYKYNKTIYTNDNFTQLVNAGSLHTFLHPKDGINIQKSLNAGFRGKWGLTSFDMKEGVLQSLSRISYYDTLSHTRRVVSDYPTELKDRSPRMLHPSQIGFFCLAEGPTGAPIGITKNLAILSTVSISSDATSFLNWLYTKGGVLSVANTSDELRRKKTTVSVQLNGGTIGFTENVIQLIIVLRYMKWTACLTPMASISFNTQELILRIYIDEGRPLRPLWHLGAGVGKEKWPAVVASKKALPIWRNLVLGTLPQTASVKGIESTSFFDPFEGKSASLEEYEKFLAPYIGCIEYIDLFESNEAYISWYGEENAQLEANHTHAEIHPSIIAGLMVNTLPFAHHNQATRWQYASGQSKQGIGYYATNFNKRFDTYGLMACAAEAPMAHTLYYDALANGKMPYGLNVILAFCTMDGYNQEDAQILNRTSVERGMFHSLALRSYELHEGIDEDNKNLETKFGNPIYVKQWTDITKGYSYSKLDEHGFIRLGEEIDDTTVLIGRYQINKKTNEITDASIIGKTFTKGRVDKIEVLVQPNGYRITKIRILEMRVPELGDKFASRHHQKGTIGMLVDAIDMPRTADGIVPDIVMNPHGLPTRMTVAQFYEQIYCKYGSIMGTTVNATNFMDKQESLETLGDLLEQQGFQRHGEELMYNGTEGGQMEASIFMAPCYIMRLKHLTEDKINSRGKGRKEMITHQPTAGRGNEGGAKIGEMERDSLIAHGITQFTKESYMKRSDGTTMWICNGCGTVPIFNQSQNLFICPTCQGGVTFTNEQNLILPTTKSHVTFSRVNIPYSYKLLDQEMAWQGNMSMRIITEKQGRTFRSIQSKSEPIKSDVLSVENVVENVVDTVSETVSEGVTSVSNALFGTTAVAAPKEDTTVSDASATDEKAIAKANAILEQPIVPAAVPSDSTTGPTIIIETGASPTANVAVESKEEKEVESAPPVEPVAAAAPVAAPAAPAAAPAAAPSSMVPPPFTLLPTAPSQKGGARPRITWAGADKKNEEAADSNVTVIKLG